MFEPPTSLSENVQQFLELSEAQKIVADLNRILHRTAFNPKLTNPCFLLALLFYFMFLGIVLPLLLRFSLNEEEPSTGLYWYIRRMAPLTFFPKGFFVSKNIVCFYSSVLEGRGISLTSKALLQCGSWGLHIQTLAFIISCTLKPKKTSATYRKQNFGYAHKNDQSIGDLHILYEKAANGEVFYKFK